MSAIVLLPGPQPEDPGRFIRVAGGQSVPGEIVVRFHDGIPQSEWPGIAAAAGATLDRDLLPAGYARVTVAPGHEEAVGAALAADPRVRSAEEIATRRLMFVPNDEYYDDQWNLSLIQMERAWDLSTGAPAGAGGAAADEEGVVVAVLDSGVAFEDYTDPANHREYKRAPDLALTEFIAPYDAYDGDTHPNDDNGHGTHVTGTIAQATNNAIGVAGIAFNARIMPVKVCGDPDGNLADDRDYFCPDDAIAEGIIYAVNNGARVINLSLGGETPIGEGSLHRQALDYARAANVPVVAAAGNGGDDFIGGPFLAYPAAIASVISVGAAGSNGQKASYSDYGLGEEGNTMDLVAPGGDGFPGGKFVRQNTYARKCSSGVPINFTLFAYCDMIGTSQATAHVTGVVALIRARYPNLSSPQVRSVLHCSALDVGQPGDDLQHGHGLVQAYWALLDSDGDNLPNCLDPEPGVECFAPQSTPTPEPTPAPTETTIPTETATPAAESDTPAPVLGPAGPVPTDTPTPPPTDTPAPPTDTPAPATDTPTPVPPTDTPTPLATEPPTPTPTDTPTPEPTATPQPSPVKYACGDVDCDLDLDAVDALFLLRLVAALEPYAVCIDYGNVDCDEGIDAVDGLGVLRKIAGLPVTQPPGCPALGYS